MEESIYTVDEVSNLLGIPRPTLYRYLREYSIPHLRRSGRIQIPEDSFDRIRNARDLHREGLGTDSVRRQLREGGGPDTGEIDRRLNGLRDTLEDLRGELRRLPATDEVALSPALRTVLARQSLMLSAMFNLTGMVEDLLSANGRPRKRPLEDLQDGPANTVPQRTGDRAAIPGAVLVEPAPLHDAEVIEGSTPARVPSSDGPTRFGSLGRRRRRSVLALLSALLLGLLLALLLPKLTAERGDTADSLAAKDAPEGAAGQAPGEQKPEEPARQEATQQGAAASEGEDGATTDASLASGEALSGKTEVQTATVPDPPGGIPDVSGRPLEEGVRAISEAGFFVAAIETVASQEDPATILKTEPSAGTDADARTAVVLTMSGGPTGILSAGVSSASASPQSISSVSASSVNGSTPASPAP